MNPAAILALVSDLYSQVVQLQADNAELREQLAAEAPGPAPPAPEARP